MSTISKLNFSELLEELGGFGKYQKFVFVLGCLAVFMPGMSVVSTIFSGHVADHRCLIPQCEFKDNTTYAKDFLNFTIPVDESGTKWDECHRFKTINTRDMTCDSKNFNPHLQKYCSEYIHDTSIFKTTIISEYELICGKAWMEPLSNSAYMLGMLLGAFILGDLADRIGRKKGLQIAILILTIGGFLSSLSINYYMFLASRLLSGLGGVATFAISFIIVVEFAPMEYRNFCGIFIGAPFALGEAIVAVLAYYIRDWRWLQASCAIPPLILIVYYWVLPESVRWSISRGRMEEAKATMKNIEKWNKVKVSDKVMIILNSNKGSNIMDASDEPTNEKRSRLDLLRYPNLRKRTFCLMYCWGVVTLTYYGLNLYSANLGGNIFINFAGLMLIEIPSTVFVFLILDRIGHKWSLSLSYLIGAAGCLISGILPSSYNTTLVVMSMIGKFGASASFSVVFVYTAEVFPTSMRSLGIGTCSTVARVAGITAPFIANLGKIYKPLPVLIFGVLGLIASIIIVIVLPETYGCELPQTILESETFGTNQSIFEFPCCGKKKRINVTPSINEAFSSS